MKDLTIIMVARNHVDQTKKAIESLVKYTDPSKFVLIFMDNAGTDHTDSWLVPFCKAHGVELNYQYSTLNLGYVGAVNRGYDMCGTRYVLTCHNDVVFSIQWYERMLRRFKDPEVAAVGPVISFAMGIQAARYAYTTFGYDVKFLLGLFFLAELDALRTVKEKYGEGKWYLCPEYGLGDKEELELCYRLTQLGFKMDIARDVYIEHEGEKTFVEQLGSQQAFYDYQNKQLEILRFRLGDTVVNDIYTINCQPKNQVKLMVGILTRTEYVHVKNMISFLKIWEYTRVEKQFYHVARGHPANDRNIIAREFLKSDCTHLLFIDDDMYFNHDAVVRLLCMDVDIASGIAYQRGEPHAPCVFMFNRETKSFYPAESPEDKETRGQVQVEAIGGFFFLIKRYVLETLESPWFVFNDTSLGINITDNPYNNGIGEDMYFSAKARMAEFEIWVDQTLDIGHIGESKNIDSDFFFEYKKSGKMEKAIEQRKEFLKV